MNVYCPKSCGICSGGDGENEIPEVINNGRCKDTKNECLKLAKGGHFIERPGHTK